MLVSSCYDLERILREAEMAFQIDGKDYAEEDIDVVIQNVKRRISKQARVDLSQYKMCDPELSQGMYQSEVVMFTNSIALIHSKLCGIAQIQRFLTKSPISLDSVNYLGYTTETMKQVLIELQRKVTMVGIEDTINAIKEKLPVITNCSEKRLFMIMVIADAIGFPEVVAATAEILYQGTL